MLTLAFTGDVMLGRGVNRAILTYGPAYPWGNTLSMLRKADLRLINLECVITRYDEHWELSPKEFFFKADPLAIETLEAADIDYVSLANNHSLDFKRQGLLEMNELLDKNRVKHSGAGKNFKAASKPALIRKRGLKIGILSITDNEAGWAAGEITPGTYFIPIDVGAPTFEYLAKQISEFRNKLDILVLSAHWGPNMVERPPEKFQEFARQMIDAGVDIFYGHSSHIFQGVEVYKNRLILYDTGDFVDDYVVDPELRNDLSFLFFVRIDKRKRINRIELIPTSIDNYQVNIASDSETKWSLNRMANLSKELGTKTAIMDKHLYVGLREEKAA